MKQKSLKSVPNKNSINKIIIKKIKNERDSIDSNVQVTDINEQSKIVYIDGSGCMPFSSVKLVALKMWLNESLCCNCKIDKI